MSDTQAKLGAKNIAIENVEEIVAEMKRDKELLEQQLAEEQEPKLRHGDYGTCNDSWVFLDGVIHWLGIVGDAKIVSLDNGEDVFVSSRIGNQLDDLKALSEDVTEFELIDDDKDKPDGVGETAIDVCIDDGSVRINFKYDGREVMAFLDEEKSLPLFMLNLKKVRATLRRQK